MTDEIKKKIDDKAREYANGYSNDVAIDIKTEAQIAYIAGGRFGYSLESSDEQPGEEYWKARCEAAEGVIDQVFDRVEMAEAHAVGTSYHNWQKLKTNQP